MFDEHAHEILPYSADTKRLNGFPESTARICSSKILRKTAGKKNLRRQKLGFSSYTCSGGL